MCKFQSFVTQNEWKSQVVYYKAFDSDGFARIMLITQSFMVQQIQILVQIYGNDISGKLFTRPIYRDELKRKTKILVLRIFTSSFIAVRLSYGGQFGTGMALATPI